MQASVAHEVRIEDRYLLEDGTVLLSGVQAAIRIVLDQMRADRRAGLTTAAIVSGYPGSPLGGLDLELARQHDEQSPRAARDRTRAQRAHGPFLPSITRPRSSPRAA